jgi:rhamnosyl/mannosyltransferase
MKRLRVLQIGKYYPPYVGGTENHLYTLVNELKGQLDIKVLVSNDSLKTEIQNHCGISIYRLGSFGRLFSLPLAFSMPFWLKKLKADILHFHLPNPLSVIAYFISRPKGKVVVSYHSDIVRQKVIAFFFNFLLIRFLKGAQIIIVTSDNLINSSDILRQFKEKCRVIPCGIDLGLFKENSDVLEKARELRGLYGSPIILFVGRLVYYKGLEYLLQAMKNIKAKLLIVGAGPLKNKLIKLALSIGINDKIIWVGQISNDKIAPYYYACDIFILPSSSQAEGFGIVQLEAFACGKPVISTDLFTGVSFVNHHGHTGIVVPARNSLAIEMALRGLIGSERLRHFYGGNARERVKEFAKEVMAKNVLTAYEALS